LFIPENRISELHEKIVTIIKQFDACGELRDKLKNINDTLWLYILALLKMKDIPMTAEHYNLLVELDQVLEHVEEKVQEDNRRIQILGAYDSPIQIGNRAVKEKIPEFREHFPFLTVPGHHEYYEIEIPLIFFSVIAGWLIWYNVAGFVDVWNIFRIFDHLTEFFLMCVSPAFATYFLLIQLFTWYLSETKEKEG
jgi:uncharacterized membrane protein